MSDVLQDLQDRLSLMCPREHTQHMPPELLAAAIEEIKRLRKAAERTIVDDVRDFHQKFGHPCPEQLEEPTPEQAAFRKKLISEEAKELNDAIDENDPVHICREALDHIYVGAGVFVTYGIPFKPCWDALQRANMRKERPPQGSPSGTKPVKPPGWVPPDDEIERAIFGAVGKPTTPEQDRLAMESQVVS